MIQTVEVTGEIKPAARIDLAFQNSGTVNAINTKVGDVVKKGDVLATLKNDDVQFAVKNAAAALAAVQANLSLKLAGATNEDIRISQAQVASAQANVDKAQLDLDTTRLTVVDDARVADLALQNAASALQNSGASADQSVASAYASLRSSLQGALGPLRSGLIDGDAIIGIDNTSANDLYEGVLGIYARGSLDHARQTYPVAKAAVAAADQALLTLSSSTDLPTMLADGDLILDAQRKTQSYLDDVQKVLAGTITNSNLSDAQLEAKKGSISGDFSSISSNLTSVTASVETARSSGFTQKTTRDSLQNAYDTAKANYDIAQRNLTTKVKSAETALAIQQAALAQAKAQLASKVAAPRNVDVAGLRASVDQANVVYQKALNDLKNVQIVAPSDGIISEILPSIGEQISLNAPAIRMVGTESYEIEAEVPEADITKIAVNQTATTTLDAYGDDVKFSSTVIDKDPAETLVQDAVYYKIHMLIDPAGREVKPGMTANVTVNTGLRQGAIVIPLRSVRTNADTGVKSVRVLVNNQPQERVVEIGLKGDDGLVEIIKGLNDGEIVVVSEKNPSPTTTSQ